MARIVLTTVGSLGDLHPMFPVADELQKRGHDITFVVPDLLHASVTAEGYPSHSVDLPGPPALPPTDVGYSTREVKAAIEAQFGPYLRRCIDVLRLACEGADVILTTPHQVASAIVGELLGIPWVTLTVFPGFIPSSYTVPQPHWLPALPTLPGRLINSLTWKVYAFALSYLASDAIESAARARGVTANKHLFAPGGLSPQLCLVLSSPHYSPPLPDWPKSIKVVGYSSWDRPRAWRPPDELTRFLESGAAPILVTTSSARNGALLLSLAKEALERLGRRGLILTGRASSELLGKADHVILDSGVSAWQYVPLSYLLPRIPLVVHHAGIGTALATIRHRLPALAIPSSFDHWYNASRLRDLGVARILSGEQREKAGVRFYKHITVDSLVRAMDDVDRDASYRRRAEELGDLMKDEDGAAGAADEIEALLGARVRV